MSKQLEGDVEVGAALLASSVAMSLVWVIVCAGPPVSIIWSIAAAYKWAVG